MDFDAVCLSVGQGKADIAMSGLTVKEDRKEYVTFSDTYYNASQNLLSEKTTIHLTTVKPLLMWKQFFQA